MKNLFPHSGFSLFLCILLVSFAHTGQAETPEQAATRLQNRYDSIKSLSFNFVQNTRGQLTGRPKTGRGQAYFLKETTPGKMRWNYSDPDRQVLVSDGKSFSMYFESLQQMIVTPATALQQDLTYSFFTGNGNLLEDFTISEADNKTANEEEVCSIIKLTPKVKQSQVASIHIWITEDSLIRRMEILDLFDTLTVLNFSDLQVDNLESENKKTMEQLFSFTPPEGTEIINQ
jgi:outer membrane lipoprotein carrier protein